VTDGLSMAREGAFRECVTRERGLECCGDCGRDFLKHREDERDRAHYLKTPL
jgi:hypothetical protein